MQEVGLIIIFAMIAITWWPSHHFFKRLRKKHTSLLTAVTALLACALIAVALIYLGYNLGENINNPNIKSLGSEAAGEPSNLNLFWFPFALLGLGLFAGFLSGYRKMKVTD